jgi:capsular polysaccharide transport system permease protein
MLDRIKQFRFARTAAQLAAWSAPLLPRQRALSAAFIASLLAVLYWGLIASDRYVSEAHVIILRTDLSGEQGKEGLSSAVAEQMLLRAHLLSVDMLGKLDARLGLRAHYSDRRRDVISRMWSRDTAMEWFHRHYLSRVSVELDAHRGVLVILTQAYDPKTAKAVADALVEEGERYMNAEAHRLARQQVAFIEKQVADMSQRAMEARHAVLDFQNRNSLVSPQGTAENLAAIVNRLEAQLSELQTRRSAMLGYLMPGSANIVELDQQIAAVEKQVTRERGRLASTNGKTLNRTVEEYQRLQTEAAFADDLYKSAMVVLEKGRVEATRTLMNVSVLQSPTLPEYPLEPRRIYNIVMFILATLLVSGIAHLVAAVIRDHKD